MSEDGAGSFTITVPKPDDAFAGVWIIFQYPDLEENEEFLISSVSHNLEGAAFSPPEPLDSGPEGAYYMSIMAQSNDYDTELGCTVDVEFVGSREVELIVLEVRQFFIGAGDVEYLASDSAETVTLVPFSSSGVEPTPTPAIDPTPTPPTDPSPTPTTAPGGGTGTGTGSGSGSGTGSGTGTAATSTPTPTPSPTPEATPTPTPDETQIVDEEQPLGSVSFLKDHIQFIFGYPDGTVHPDAGVTRAEAVTMIFRLIDDADKEAPAESAFTDVPQNAWYAQYVAYAASKGIVQGYPDGGFHPDDSITRAEFATIMARFLAEPSGAAPDFADVPAGHWAAGYIGACVANGWIKGYPDGTFMPESSITRAESVAVLNRMLNRGIAIDDIPGSVPSYGDLPKTHWAYADIIEASVAHEYTRNEGGTEIWP